jgi:energy-coupling factor transporter transmembrane protein EcfT
MANRQIENKVFCFIYVVFNGLFVFFIIFLIIMLVITYYVNYQFFWVLLFCQTPFLLFMFFQNIRPFFPKGKKDEYDNQNNRED